MSAGRNGSEPTRQRAWCEIGAATSRKVGLFGPGGNLIGGIVLRVMRRFGLAIARNPAFTPSVGPFLERRATSVSGASDENRHAMDAIATYLDDSRFAVVLVAFGPEVVDMLPFRWKGFKVVPGFTYRLDLTRTNEAAFARYSENKRRSIRRALKDGLVADIGREFGEVARLQTAVLATEGAGGRDALPGVVRCLEADSASYTVCVRRREALLAGCAVAGQGQTVYYVLGGHAPGPDGRGHHGAGSLALHEAIKTARERGAGVFDFEGSTVERVEPFIRDYGGTLTPYFCVAKAWGPIECALKLRMRETF